MAAGLFERPTQFKRMRHYRENRLRSGKSGWEKRSGWNINRFRVQAAVGADAAGSEGLDCRFRVPPCPGSSAWVAGKAACDAESEVTALRNFAPVTLCRAATSEDSRTSPSRAAAD